MKTWGQQKHAEKRWIEASRRQWLASMDHLTPAEAARQAHIDPTSLHRIMRQTGYKWRGPDYVPPKPAKRTLQPTITNLRRGMTPEQRERMDRAIKAGVKPIYAAAQAMGIAS